MKRRKAREREEAEGEEVEEEANNRASESRVK